MAKTQYLFVPGLFADSGPSSWTARAVAAAVARGAKATAYTYWSNAFFAWFAQNDHLAGVMAAIRTLQQLGPVEGVGHSNGAELIVQALKNDRSLQVQSVHLVVAACKADCRSSWGNNGLNDTVARGQIGRVYLYNSPVDEWLGGSWVLGWGDLGKEGPRNATPQLLAATDVTVRNYAHCEWLNARAEEIFPLLLRNCPTLGMRPTIPSVRQRFVAAAAESLQVGEAC